MLEFTAKDLSEMLKMSKSAVIRRSKKESWDFQTVNNRNGGGKRYIYYLPNLPSDVQKRVIEAIGDDLSPEDIAKLGPEAQLETYKRLFSDQPSFSSFSSFPSLPATVRKELLNRQQKLPFCRSPVSFFGEKSFSLDADVLRDDRVGSIARIVQEANSPDPGYKKSKWIELIAIRHNMSVAQIYRYLKRYNQAGLAGLKHRKNTRGRVRSWTPEALDFWVGLCLKREHKDISKDKLYECLTIEARRRGWQIGGYRSALWWFDKRVTPQLLALQRGGTRALDNTLPPICRDYSDLKPFEILVGDQHRFDFWIQDEETGQVFRPEGYFWQDLRTRLFYGGAVGVRYDAQLMGLALRIGLKRFGAFGAIYTDHGKSEESRYVLSILKEMRALGLRADQSLDVDADIGHADPEETNCRVEFPGDHRRAIVRKAKAKMIEGTFRVLETILRSETRLPGRVKRLTAPKEEQEYDEKEIARLAQKGRLLTFREFILAVYRAMDFYNAKRPHRGVLGEWLWDPKPGQATPMQCLFMCRRDGWRPRRLSDDAIDLVFLCRERRTVDRGRITFHKERYEADALVGLDPGERVEIRYDPLDPSWILVFHRGEFLCRAVLMEYSSMKDQELARRKIAQKARRRRIFLDEYRDLTSWVPDLRQYSTVPEAERTAAIVGKAKREALARREAEEDRYRIRAPEELAAEIKKIDDWTPPRTRPVFTRERDRYQWCLDTLARGEAIEAEDEEFVSQFESKLNPESRRYFAIYKETIGLVSSQGGKS
jgi:putative transposase